MENAESFIRCSAQLRPGVVCTPVVTILERWRQEELKFKGILGYIVNLKPTWAYVRPCFRQISVCGMCL